MAGKIAADAALMVADAALNGVFQGLSQALTPPIQKKLGQFFGIEKELKKLKRYLLGVQPLLKDAEIRQFTDEPVRSWVTDLMGVAYDMEDIVDEMNTQILRLEIEEKNRNDEEQVQNLFSSLNLDKFLSGVQDFSFKNQIASKINEVLERWEEIVEYGNALRLREEIGGRTLEDIRKRRETTSIQYENRVFGRDDDLKEISSLLKSDHGSNGENVSVIAIVGMGGSGKTTLAKLAYNDPKVEFDRTAWVYVSREFDCKRVTESIIESLQGRRCDLPNLDQMQLCLRGLVENKKYLIVLDDAWTENPDDWDCLMAPLREGGKGSRIMVTTRTEIVSKSIGATATHILKGLSDDDCWAIVLKKALGNNDTDESQRVEGIKMDVVSKCKGLPLVANVIGGLLRTVEIDNWGRLLKSKLWDLPKTKDDILPALKLSYLSLSPPLKRCFTYCALFGKGYDFKKDKLVQLWMAEGFVESNESQEPEDVGNDYFDDLVARHFLQKSSEYSWNDYYVMHDLNHDLAQFVMGNISFTRIKEENRHPTEETRYMFLGHDVFNEKQWKQFLRAKVLRTLWAAFSSIDVGLNGLVQNFERLRVLRLIGGLRVECVQELPESLGNLKHLRFLSVQSVHIKSLPDSICSLYNLQTLNLSYCKALVELPRNMGNLINLRYLNLSDCGDLMMLPDSSIRSLYNLQTLNFSYCNALVELPRNMGNLINLRHLNLHSCTNLRMLPDSICKLESLRVIHLGYCKRIEALPTNIGNLKNLRRLFLGWSGIQRLPDSISRFYNLELLCLQSCDDLLEFPEDIIYRVWSDTYRLVIGKGRGIQQLKNFKGRGLYLEDLQNVKSVEEAKTACIKNMHQIVDLELTWKQVDPLNLRDENFEADVLEALEPAHAKLEKLTISNYCGFNLPRWMGDPLFTNIVEIKLIGCVNCKLLAPLGQLCSLKTLIIEGMRELKHVGREFFGNGAFPSLQMLGLKNSPNLEGQFEVKEGDFSCLTELRIVDCPKLRELPIAPLSLKQLVVCGNEDAVNLRTLPLLPSLRDLEVGCCNEMILLNSLPYLTSVVSLKIRNLPGVKELPNGLLQPLAELRKLVLDDCYELLSLPEDLPDTLSELKISRCPNLSSLPKGLPNMSSLTYLKVEDCPRLEISPEEFIGNGAFPSLQLLALENLPNLEGQFEVKEGDFSCLTELRIVDCPKLTTLPLLPSLRALEVGYCNETILLNSLPYLTSVVSLKIRNLPGVKELRNGLLQPLAELRELVLDDCYELLSLPEGLPDTLSKLEIIGCPNLSCLPKGLPNMSSLTKLVVEDCPRLEISPEEFKGFHEYRGERSRLFYRQS